MQKTRQKQQPSGFLFQAIVLGIILIIAIALFTLIYSGFRNSLDWIFDTTPKPEETKTTEIAVERPEPASTSTAGTKDVYIWTDEKGVKNFSSRPPPAHVTEFEKRKCRQVTACPGKPR